MMKRILLTLLTFPFLRGSEITKKIRVDAKQELVDYFYLNMGPLFDSSTQMFRIKNILNQRSTSTENIHFVGIADVKMCLRPAIRAYNNKLEEAVRSFNLTALKASRRFLTDKLSERTLSDNERIIYSKQMQLLIYHYNSQNMQNFIAIVESDSHEEAAVSLSSLQSQYHMGGLNQDALKIAEEAFLSRSEAEGLRQFHYPLGTNLAPWVKYYQDCDKERLEGDWLSLNAKEGKLESRLKDPDLSPEVRLHLQREKDIVSSMLRHHSTTPLMAVRQGNPRSALIAWRNLEQWCKDGQIDSKTFQAAKTFYLQRKDVHELEDSAAISVEKPTETVSSTVDAKIDSSSQLASEFLNTEFGITPDRYFNFSGTAEQLKNDAVIKQALNNNVSYLHQAKTIEEQGMWAVAIQANVEAFKQNESGALQGATFSAQSLDQSELVEIASQVVSRIGDNAQHPISFIQEKVAEVANIGCAIADLTIGQAFRTPEQQVQRIQEFAATIDSYAGLPWAEKKTIFVNAIADIITVTGFATAGKMVTSLAANIPQYLPAITAAFSEGTSELLSALSETLYGASFSGGGAAAAQTSASQEVIANSIAQVASGFAVAIAADGSATVSMPDPSSVLRQDSEKTTGGSAPDVVKSKPAKTVDDLISEATFRKQKRRAKIYDKCGTYQDMLKDFENMNLTEVRDISSGKLGKLPDGKAVTARMKSSDGAPTLEIFNPIKNKSVKFRYGD